MGRENLENIRKWMKKLDICMMTTISGRGTFHSRPMSNNGDVAYNGHSYFFSNEGSKKIRDIQNNPQVSLEFSGPEGLFISVAGKAKLIRSRAKMEAHWQPGLQKWFKYGLDTPGIVMLHVAASRIAYWQKNKQGELKL